MNTTAVSQRVRSSTDNGSLETVGRIGLVGRGLLHGVVAWLALTVAHGDAHRRADSQGALATLAHQPLGRGLVLAVGVTLAAYAVWSLATVTRDDNNGAAAVGRAVVYAVLAVVAFSLVVGAGSGGGGGGGGGQESGFTARVLHWPGGRLLVLAAGLAVVGGGLANLWKIHGRKWAEGLRLERHSVMTQRVLGVLATVGLAARGVAFGLVGLFLLRAGWLHDPGEATGLDGALKRLAATAHGPGLLTLVAIGLLAYGGWCVAVAALHPNGRA